MDAVLRQSKAMCPFLKKASPATLRALSTSTRPQASPCGGTISKLQLLGQRCPIMGKALAVQTARNGMPGAAATAAGVRAFSGHQKTAKAKIHTSRAHEARAMDGVYTPREGKCFFVLIFSNFQIFGKSLERSILAHGLTILSSTRPAN
jgi:5-aminolevulinate synthase